MRRFAQSLAVAIIGLSGCATVPSLEAAHGVDSKGHIRVQNIVDHIACELYRSIPDNPELIDQKYYVKILLNLQVDDEVDLTPSITAINPITATTNIATVASGDLGFQRRRLFTTTYNVDMARLKEDYDESTAAPECRSTAGGFPNLADKPYNLQGDLGIEQIIDDGLKVVQDGTGIITNPSKLGDTNSPTFGSQVQFIVTRQVSSLGPIWTLKYFKGPSGSNGIISGKVLDTDSLTITFSPQLVSSPQLAAALKTRSDLLQKLAAAKKQQLTAKPANRAALDAEVANLTVQVEKAEQVVAVAQGTEPAQTNRGSADAATTALQTAILLQILSNLSHQ